MNDIVLLQLENMTPTKWIALITNYDFSNRWQYILINIGI